ncbi:hypothetical protein DIPPA_26880 [Diplonema papillatum]|nr:hypothetical protein DIPPA_26880 [Diplonema papillatum]
MKKGALYDLEHGKGGWGGVPRCVQDAIVRLNENVVEMKEMMLDVNSVVLGGEFRGASSQGKRPPRDVKRGTAGPGRPSVPSSGGVPRHRDRSMSPNFSPAAQSRSFSGSATPKTQQRSRSVGRSATSMDRPARTPSGTPSREGKQRQLSTTKELLSAHKGTQAAKEACSKALQNERNLAKENMSTRTPAERDVFAFAIKQVATACDKAEVIAHWLVANFNTHGELLTAGAPKHFYQTTKESAMFQYWPKRKPAASANNGDTDDSLRSVVKELDRRLEIARRAKPAKRESPDSVSQDAARAISIDREPSHLRTHDSTPTERHPGAGNGFSHTHDSSNNINEEPNRACTQVKPHRLKADASRQRENFGIVNGAQANPSLTISEAPSGAHHRESAGAREADHARGGGRRDSQTSLAFEVQSTPRRNEVSSPNRESCRTDGSESIKVDEQLFGNESEASITRHSRRSSSSLSSRPEVLPAAATPTNRRHGRPNESLLHRPSSPSSRSSQRRSQVEERVSEASFTNNGMPRKESVRSLAEVATWVSASHADAEDRNTIRAILSESTSVNSGGDNSSGSGSSGNGIRWTLQQSLADL